MFLLTAFREFMGTAVPVLVQLGIVYLVLRFTFAVSNVLIRLAVLNIPPKPAEVPAPVADKISDAEFAEFEEERVNGENKEPAALPESTGGNYGVFGAPGRASLDRRRADSIAFLTSSA